jgi:outer membrane protein OmpA-like peptidoglycan-associated protein
MVLDSSTHEIIKQDSVASIQTEGLLGNQFVAISFGSPGQPNVKNDGTIRSEPPLLMADMLKKANGILDGALQTVQNTTLATAHLSAITGKINDGQGTIGELINNKQIYNNLQQSTSSMQSTMANAQVGVTDFQENMEALKHNFLLNGFFKKRGYEDASQLAADRVSALPQGAPAKEFDFTAKQLFDGHDSAKLKDKKTLKELGDYLAHNPFGFAVVVDSTDMEGDSHKDQVLTEARAMVVREYLVENFGFNDSLLKTMGIGKQAVGANSSDWGAIKVLVYPAGTPVPQAASQAQPATKP